MRLYPDRDLGVVVMTNSISTDAVVPNWRFSVSGPAAIADVYGRWFDRPVRVTELRRFPITGGEVLEYTLHGIQDERPIASRHAHVLHVADDGRIVSDHVWCGGLWPAHLLARMEAAQHHRPPSR